MKNIIVFIVLVFSLQSGYSQEDMKANMDRIVDKYYSSQNNPGIMLQIFNNNAETVYAVGAGKRDLKSGMEIDNHSNFRMASVSKQFTAAAIYQLVQDKKLNVSAYISEFFPGLRAEVRKASVFQLLNHTSGIVDYEEVIPENQETQLSDSDVLKLVEPLDRVYFAPGSQFRYSNTAYCLLALIVEKVSGQGFSEYVREKFFQPLKMEHSIVYSPADNIKDRAFGYHLNEDQFVFADQSITSTTKGDGGVYTSAEEYKQWEVAFFQRLKDDSLFNRFFVDNYSTINPSFFYSMGKFVGKDQDGDFVYFHSGESTGFNNFVLSIPAKNLHLSLFSNRDDQIIEPFIDEVLKSLDIRIQGLDNKPIFKWLSDVYANKF
ncbi:hypothetical protein CHU00_17095 [Sphingobacterium cellulitidis]|uniref:serine hydrolase domain-containing protein n=1 Tax=Sphingobacterium cellulitidis TaxID=1768011 RepID=UPI000B93E547|nr:serine hydrolase domain-containing protein [Sphingobacterium cellulitidis]OYD44370.1 hypothetical protein CHU00_17095 [Sphingobacterium cellulitidis]